MVNWALEATGLRDQFSFVDTVLAALTTRPDGPRIEERWWNFAGRRVELPSTSIAAVTYLLNKCVWVGF